MNASIRCYAAAWAVLAALLAAGCARQEPTVRYSDLAARLTNRTVLARLDAPPARLISSYDRKGGNDDFNNYLRKGPEGWIVLADLTGPGYVSRFWFTGAESGKQPVRFYFDGERSPRIDTTLEDYCGGKAPSLPPLAAYEPYCWFSWVPVPYQKRLIIMTREGGNKPGGGPKLYYQVNYNALPAGSSVASWPQTPGADDLNTLETVRQALAGSFQDRIEVEPRPWGQPAAAETPGVPPPVAASNAVVVGAGQKIDLATLSGPALVSAVGMKLSLEGFTSELAKEALMRDLILRVYWNGATEPSVEVPFGDFFGSVWRRRQFQSAYFGMSNGLYTTRFPMPFEGGARFEIENQSKAAFPIVVEIQAERLASWTNAWGYFHAGWRRSGPEQVGKPHRILGTQGRGRFVGCILAACSLDKSWWLLEGDESIRVDGETSPSWHGTGLEDYFNAGWYYGTAIIRPFHGLISKVHFSTVQYRVHQTDPVAFNTSCDMQIERGSENVSHGAMESVAFYYLSAPARADSSLGDSVSRRPPEDSQLVPVTPMIAVNDMERIGDFTGAAAYVAGCLERMPDYPYAPVLKLRQIMYAERRAGFKAAQPGYAALTDSTTNGLARAQAGDWLWFHSAVSNALLGLYCNTPTHVFLDGRHIAQAGDEPRMQFFRVTLEPGRHVLALQSRFHAYPAWALACLRTHQGDLPDAAAWRYAIDPPANWASLGDDDKTWKLIGGPDRSKGPPEEPYLWLEPNMFVGMQSSARRLWVPVEWNDPRGHVVFRNVFDVAAPAATP